MRAASFMALTAGLLGKNMPSFDPKPSDKEKLDQRFVDEAKAKAEAKRRRRATKKR